MAIVNLFVFIIELKWFITQRFRVFSTGIMWNQQRVTGYKICFSFLLYRKRTQNKVSESNTMRVMFRNPWILNEQEMRLTA